jgi:hypothetical protein
LNTGKLADKFYRATPGKNDFKRDFGQMPTFSIQVVENPIKSMEKLSDGLKSHVACFEVRVISVQRLGTPIVADFGAVSHK